MAFLQVVGLRNANSAYVRSQATILAYDIVDRMRANKASASSYVIAATSPTPSANGTVANTDTIDWRGSIADALPNGTGAVSLDADVATVTITWYDSSQDTVASQTQSYTYSSRL